MHELSITQSLIEIAEKAALDQGAQKVLSVTVEIGALSGVVAEAVEFAFEACSRDTMLETARLIIEPIAGKGRCGQCGLESAMDQYTLACSHCEAFALEVQQGKELRIRQMEID